VIGAVALVGAVGLPCAAHAQDSESGGLHLGQFWVLPTLEAGAFYDSNPNLEPSGEGSSGGAYVAPTIEAKSDFNRHALNFALGAEHFQYFNDDVEEDARTNFFGKAQSRLDIRHDLILNSGIRGGLFEDNPHFRNEPFEDVTDLITPANASEPDHYSVVDTWSALTKVFNRLAVTADVAYHTADFDDLELVGGGTLDQDFRDVNRYDVGGRAGYEFSPGYSVFVDGHYNDRLYDTNENDSHGWRALTGVAFEITNLLKGEVGVGYVAQDYDEGAEVSDVSYHLGLVWEPTQLMTVRLDGDRLVGESSLKGSPGTIETSIRALVDYEVLRTLTISPFVGATFQEFIDSPVEAQAIFAGVGADYEINRFLSVGFDYKFEDVQYSGEGADYNRHIVGVNAAAHF
jgi:hypothetical protein